MKSILLLFLGAVALQAQQPQPQKPEERPLAQITFRVVTDGGEPIGNVEIALGTFHHWEPGEGFGKDVAEVFTGTTNEKGLVTISGRSLRGDFKYNPRQKEGFYRGGGGEYLFKEAKNGQWQPWNPTVDVVLKPIINPIAMYARKLGSATDLLELPQKNQPVGFDLLVGDWVAPYGKGSTSDLVFTLTEKTPFVSVEKPYDVALTMTFSNKADGIQSVLTPSNQMSELRLPRYAPEAGYNPQLVKQMGRPAEGEPINSGTREDQNYFFRVRTVLDKDGKIQSAIYGKIIGDVACDVINSKTGLLQFAYCLNPTPNDRNMEFDPKKNLFGRLPLNQRVTTP